MIQSSILSKHMFYQSESISLEQNKQGQATKNLKTHKK